LRVVADRFDVVHGDSVLGRAGESGHPVTRMGRFWNLKREMHEVPPFVIARESEGFAEVDELAG